jgi:hypothetical protein
VKPELVPAVVVQLANAPPLHVGFTVPDPSVPPPPATLNLTFAPVPQPAPAWTTVQVPFSAPVVTPSVAFGCVVQLPLVAKASGTVTNPPGPPATETAGHAVAVDCEERITTPPPPPEPAPVEFAAGGAPYAPLASIKPPVPLIEPHI